MKKIPQIYITGPLAGESQHRLDGDRITFDILISGTADVEWDISNG